MAWSGASSRLPRIDRPTPAASHPATADGRSRSNGHTSPKSRPRLFWPLRFKTKMSQRTVPRSSAGSAPRGRSGSAGDRTRRSPCRTGTRTVTTRRPRAMPAQASGRPQRTRPAGRGPSSGSTAGHGTRADDQNRLPEAVPWAPSDDEGRPAPRGAAMSRPPSDPPPRVGGPRAVPATGARRRRPLPDRRPDGSAICRGCSSSCSSRVFLIPGISGRVSAQEAELLGLHQGGRLRPSRTGLVQQVQRRHQGRLPQHGQRLRHLHRRRPERQPPRQHAPAARGAERHARVHERPSQRVPRQHPPADAAGADPGRLVRVDDAPRPSQADRH